MNLNFKFFELNATDTNVVGGFYRIMNILLSSLVGGYWLSIVVIRARKCLDFGATIYFYHLFFTWMYGGFPSTFSWWITHIMGLACMVFLGEQLCMKKEMVDITVGGGSSEAVKETGNLSV